MLFRIWTCDQRPLDAERIDEAIVEYLDRLFVDVGAWAEELARGTEQQRAASRAALDAALAELDRLDRRAGKIEADYVRQVEAGNERAGDLAARMLARTENERRGAERRIEALRREPAAQDDPVDAALDLYDDLRRNVRGGDGSLADLNERLRAEFEEFRLDRVDEGVVGVLPGPAGARARLGRRLPGLAGGR